MGNFDLFFNEQMYVIVILSIVFFLFSCVGISIFVTYRILNRYNDFGEVPVCSIHQYSYDGIKYRVNRDYVSPAEKNDYMLVNGDNPFENIERSIPEQLLKNSGIAAGKSEDNP